ncbi:hypothetical protein AAV97_17130 [Acinetobacter sp. Ag2]|uniref:hypothetical protein n=1 Tax=Acinetobacter sp. Ag2 TaxID=1646532 RepID=UPI0006297F60|nr:hypothetical protein [Acinetobacter sp. Ag2]KKW76119.1 hypothetical protein AAV97_17130 [Acinetobacter sp. Ag2]
MEIKSFDIEGSVDEIAAQLFKKMIGPIFDHLAQTDPELAVEFGYSIAGNGIACYMNSPNDVSKAEKLIIESTQSMAADIKRHRNKVC